MPARLEVVEQLRAGPRRDVGRRREERDLDLEPIEIVDLEQRWEPGVVECRPLGEAGDARGEWRRAGEITDAAVEPPTDQQGDERSAAGPELCRTPVEIDVGRNASGEPGPECRLGDVEETGAIGTR